MKEDKSIHIYVCEDQIESIFTAVYNAWSSGYGHQYNRVLVGPVNNYELFAEYITVVADPEKSRKVTDSVKKKIGLEAYSGVYDMAISNREDKGEIIYRFLILGFYHGPNVMNFLSNDYVSAIVKTAKNVWNEVHHYYGFVRFSELSGGILLSQIRPKNNILTLIAPHFADRLQQENWMIIDEGREIAVVHPAHKPWFMMALSMIDPNLMGEYSKKEKTMSNAWTVFVESIGIKERENYKLRRNMLPMRFREYMPEFQEEKINDIQRSRMEY